MKTPFEMSYFLAFGFVGICIFFGVFLRARLGVLQRFLVPACMIGGVTGMIVVNLGWIPLDPDLFQAIAYHFFIISFISIGLTGGEKRPGEKGKGKSIVKGALWMGLINGASMASQALLGCLMVVLMSAAGMRVPLHLGLFLPLGYTQGPGQALAVGKVWEAEGFVNAVSLGLAFAAMGFFLALFVGIPLVNWGIRKGYTKLGMTLLPESFRRGIYEKGRTEVPTGMMTTHPANVDSLAFQAGAVGIVYLLTYVGFWAADRYIGQLSSATWGFFFFFGMLVGMLVRWGMQKTNTGYLLNRDTQNRITSLGVDVLVTATLISVKLSVVWDYMLPLLVIAAAGGVWTTAYMIYFGRRVGELGFERMCVQYGCNTGTVSTGLLLLRVVDPGFDTTVSVETGLYSIFAAPFILGTMMVIVYSQKWGLTALHQMGIYLGIFLVALILLRVFRLWGKRNW